MNRAFALGALIGLLATGSSLRGQGTAAAVELKGIVTYSTNQLALLKIPGRGSALPQEVILGKHQRLDDVEVLEIDTGSGTVVVNKAGERMTLTLPSEPSTGARTTPSSGAQKDTISNEPASFRLQGAGTSLVLAMYQQLAQRTVIRPTALPELQLDVASEEPLTRADAMERFRKALRQKGIVTRLDRDKFVIVTKEGTPDPIGPELWTLAVELGKSLARRADTSSAGSPSATEELIPPGMIDFRAADMHQVIDVYQDLVNRTLLHPARVTSTASLKTQTSLTLTEAIYALTALLAVNGTSALAAGDKFLLLFPNEERKKAEIILSRKMPDHPISQDKAIPVGGISLPWSTPQDVMSVYKDLCGQPVEIGSDVPSIRLSLRTQTQLNPREFLYALDVLLGWHGLSVVTKIYGQGLALVRAD